MMGKAREFSPAIVLFAAALAIWEGIVQGVRRQGLHPSRTIRDRRRVQ